MRDIATQLTRASGRAAWRTDFATLPRVMRWALPWAILGRVSRDANPYRWLAKQAQRRPFDLALASPSLRLTFRELSAATVIRAARLEERGVHQGHRVAIQLPSEPTLVLTLLACWRLGAVPCPLDPDLPFALEGPLLERLAPDWWIGDGSRECAHVAPAKRIHLGSLPLTPHAEAQDPPDPIASERPAAPPSARALEVVATRHVPLHATQTAMVLPTSGTEGRAKLCRLSAGRLALSGHAFGGLALRCRRHDVIYCPLPLYHATAITVAMMPALVHGVALYLPGKFSASQFWAQLQESQATQLVYVGDLLRYAARCAPADRSPVQRLRVAVGNGLDARTWHVATERLGIPRIVEFYGATEAPSALLNFSGRTGSLGRVPLRRLSRYQIVRWQPNHPAHVSAASSSVAQAEGSEVAPPASGVLHQPIVEGARGQWLRCEPGQVGELWIRVPASRRPWLGDFEGYLSASDERRALVEHVFRPGDRFYRTYDLVRSDEDDFLYFVDRVGEVWRNKGNNVSTSWLAAELRSCEGVDDALVVAVALDASSRRFGLAVVVTSGADWRVAVEQKLRSLPSYARPQLVQVVRQIPLTATHKPRTAPWREWPWEPFPRAMSAVEASGNHDSSPTFVYRDRLEAITRQNWDKIRDELLS